MPRRAVSLSLTAALAAAVASCTPEPRMDNSAHFALTEARVRLTGDQTYSMNLLFLDDAGSPVWDELGAVSLDGGVEVTGFEVVAGDRTDSGRLGNLMVDVEPGRDAVVQQVEPALRRHRPDAPHRQVAVRRARADGSAGRRRRPLHRRVPEHRPLRGRA